MRSVALAAVPAALAPALAALAAASPAAAHGPAAPATVTILFQAYDPPQRAILAGDALTWTNTSTRDHTVSSREGRFDSGPIGPQGRFVQGFGSAGIYPYFCRIHPTMSGVVDVRALLLEGPTGALAPGSQVELAGRAIPGVSPVTIQQNSGAGFRSLANVAVADGRFHAVVRPQNSTTYRAVAGPHVSPPVRLLVGRPLALAARRHGRKRMRLTARALAAQPGTVVVLQTWLKERFGWWPVARRRLDRSSQASFTVRKRSRGRRMRAVLTEPDGVTAHGVSNVVRVGRAPRRSR